MCGIAGIVDYRRPAAMYTETLGRMRDFLRHRGPDEQNIALFDHAGLVHTRLSIIDPQGSQQPFRSADGRWAMTYNGEVYNYSDLRRDLARGWNFKTQGDTEVVMAAWAQWGAAGLSRLNGMFAFFIWDNHERKGYLVRDMLGIKPAVWRYDSGIFMFASEAKVLAGIDRGMVKADEHAVLEYLAAPFFSGVSSTMFAGIRNLQPGTFIEVGEAGIVPHTWADYRLDIAEDHVPDLHEPLKDAVRRTLVSDVPVCSFLSGGFDSTLITALARRMGEGSIDAYTIQFPDQDKFQYSDSVMTNADDTPFAVDFAHEAGVRHNLVMAESRTLAERIRKVAIANDALPAWEQELAQHALSEAAGKHYKVALVGDAADETHYGYHFLLDPHASASPENVIRRFVHDGFIRQDRVGNAAAYFDAQYRSFCKSGGYEWGKNANDNVIATTYLIVKRWLPRLLHNGDIHSMNFSLESRVPFGDTDLLDLSRKISPYKAYRDGREKYWLRECSRGLLPENIRLRKKSALPKDQNVLHVYRDELCKAMMEDDGFIGHFVAIDKLAALCDPQAVPDEKDRALMFRVICLSHWRNHYNVAL